MKKRVSVSRPYEEKILNEVSNQIADKMIRIFITAFSNPFRDENEMDIIRALINVSVNEKYSNIEKYLVFVMKYTASKLIYRWDELNVLLNDGHEERESIKQISYDYLKLMFKNDSFKKDFIDGLQIRGAK